MEPTQMADETTLDPEDRINSAQFAAMCNVCVLEDAIERVITAVPNALEINPDTLAKIIASAVAMGSYVAAGLVQEGIEAPDEELEQFARQFPHTVVAMHNLTKTHARLLADIIPDLPPGLSS